MDAAKLQGDPSSISDSCSISGMIRIRLLTDIVHSLCRHYQCIRDTELPRTAQSTWHYVRAAG